MKFKKILAVLLIMAVLATLAGCNYVQRPSGVANNGADISKKLSDLLIIPTYTYEDATSEDVYEYNGPPIENEEPSDEPVEEPDPILNPFNSTYDANTLLTKIEELMQTMKTERGVANSATGVSDELLSGRAIKILVPDDFPIDDENEAVEAMVAQYGCAVNVRRVGTGSAYVAACRRAVLSGDDVDLMYVDNAIWGDVHSFTQSINNFVNFDLGDKLNTFSASFSKKFYVQDDLDENTVYYHVAAGIGAPYMLAYNRANIKPATLAESFYVKKGELITLRAIEVTDPVEMYNNRTWGINAFTEMLKASTGGTQVGLASKIDVLNGIDIWYGMENCAGFQLSFTTGKASAYVNAVQSESADALQSASADIVQSWYWNLTGADKKNYVGSLEDVADWADNTVYDKLFNRYSGIDAIESYAFTAVELSDFAKMAAMGDMTTADWDFVAYPYGTTYEETYRALTEEEFKSKVQADSEITDDVEFEKEIITPVAGWAGGFAVMKTCENPSVALRIAEEYTKIWKAENEAPCLEYMTDVQKARYADMKENIGLSFVRSWATKAADVNIVYPGYDKYFFAGSTASTTTSNIITNQNANAYSSERAYYAGLSFFEGDADLVTQPMYHKNTPASIYSPEIHATYSDFMEGAQSVVVNDVRETARVIEILNASLLPGTVLFQW